MFRIPFEEAKGELLRVLLTRGCPEDKAEAVAYEMTRNSLEGTYTHGINRFLRLIRNIDEGIVNIDAMPDLVNAFGAIENYDGNLGLGIVNARFAMGRAIELAGTHGIGMAAMRNTNHWLRASTYGYQACQAGMAALCTSNTMPNMPTWGAVDARLGNNPLTIAIPRKKGHLIVDMSMSQYSYGAMELAQLAGNSMKTDAGYDTNGDLTRDPGEVILSKRPLPMGYWKGAGLSFLLDAFAGCMAMGNMVADIGRLPGDEHGLSQVFIAVNIQKISPAEETEAKLDNAVNWLLDSQPSQESEHIVYPGQRAVKSRKENLLLGIPVDETTWQDIKNII